MVKRSPYAVSAIATAISVVLAAAAPQGSWSFAIVGDRTGEVHPGIYERIWKEIEAEHPALAVTVGDSIQGGHDETAEAEWSEVERIWRGRKFPLYLTPGNHDIWSAASERMFREHAGHPPQYSFDYEQAHFTILDNSGSDELSKETLEFLESDLKAHAAAPVKLIFSHRPSWLMRVALGNPEFPLHQMAKKYGVRYVIAGHVHQMIRLQLEGITYVSMPSSGGQLRIGRAS